MNDYPEALVEKVARALADSNEDRDDDMELVWMPYMGDAVAALDVLGFAPHVGSIYWRSAIHVEASK